PVSGDQKEQFKSSFSHEKESASPAFYQVFLDDYNVHVRLTSTLRCGFHEYHFENPGNRRILFDLGRANNRVSDWEITQDERNEVSSFQRMGRERIYFHAILSSPIEKLETVERNDEHRGYAMLHLTDGDAETVRLKIAISFVSV